MDSDFLLIQKMKNGDDQAIDAFVRKYYPAILKYCHLHISDRDYAEDLTQDTFEQFFRSFQDYHHSGKALNYLYVIAANKCTDFYKRQRELAIEDVPEQADTGTENVDVRLDVRRAIKALPDELKDAARLFYFQDIKQKDIAKILGIGLPLVKYRIRKAKEILTKKLRQEVSL